MTGNMELILLGRRERCGNKWRDVQAKKGTEQ